MRIPRLALPAALTFAVIIGAPMPDVVANETTLTDAYPGERISFAGSYERGALIRYAITCCRADASPVVVRLSQPLCAREHSWWRVDGTIVRQGASLALATRNAIPIAPPSDPFIYR